LEYFASSSSGVPVVRLGEVSALMISPASLVA